MLIRGTLKFKPLPKRTEWYDYYLILGNQISKYVENYFQFLKKINAAKDRRL